MSYPIVTIPPDAREDTEQLGSKPKFWVLLDSGRWLFKEARPQTGEDWSEKVAAELAELMGVRAATVELAVYEDRRGSLSKSFVNVEAGESLIHGNEILAMRVTGYDREKKFRQSDHTIENIEAAIRSIFPASRAVGVLTELAGYMVLDALIGNTDRHHENWGLLQVPTGPRSFKLTVAPSFDHASSLGRELRDQARAERLAAGAVESYIRKGRGGIFRRSEDRRGENPVRLVQVAARAYPEYFRPALEKIASLRRVDVRKVIDRLPEQRASALAKQFAEEMIVLAKQSLMETLK